MKKKKTDEKSSKLVGLLSLGLLALVGCSDLDVNFQVNGQDALTGLETEDEILNPDSSDILKVYVGDTVIFRNTTEPVENVKSQRWDIDGDELIDEEFDGISGFKTVFTKPDRFMAALWVNDAEIPVRKWIEVQGDFEFFEANLPSINFIKPSGRLAEAESRNFKVEASLTEIYSSDSLVLLANGVPTDFDFDESQGILSKELKLENGDNEIELYAYTENGEVYSDRTIVSFASTSSPKKTVYVPPVEKKKKEPKSTSELDNVFSSTEKTKPEVKPEPKPEPKPKAESPNKNLTEFAKAGYRTDGITEACRNELIESYSFTITPSKFVRIDDFVVFNTVCGKLEITISSPEGELMSTTETLTEGKSQISLGLFNEVFLSKGIQYVVTLTTAKGNSNCGSIEAPKLVDTKACSPELRKKSHLTTNFKGKSIIHDITYSY